MATENENEQNKSSESANTDSAVTPNQEQQKTASTEVLGADGAPVVSKGAEALAGIFDKMASGENPLEAKPKQDDKKQDAPAAGEDAASKEKSAEQNKEKKSADSCQQEKPAAKTDDETISDDDLQPSPLDKPKTQKRIQALLKKVEEANAIVATTKKEADEKAKRLAELEAKLGKEGDSGSAVLDDKVKAQLDELSMYRRRYELETDPEIKSKFDDKITARESDIIGILKTNQASEALIKAIEAEGGVAKFAKSNKQLKLSDGTVVTARQLFQDIRDRLTEASPADAIAFDAALQDQFRLESEKVRHIEAERAKAKEYFTEKEKKAKEASEQLKTKVESWISKVSTEDPAFKDLEIPSDASPEKKKEIAEENVYRKQLRDVLRNSVYTNNPDEYLDVVKDATMLYPVKREAEKAKKLLAERDAEIAKLKEELDKVRGASKTTVGKGGSISSGQGAQPKSQQGKARSIEDEFAAIAGGSGE